MTTPQLAAQLTTEDGSGPFSSIAGLPLHPLVVHLAVVVLPASALALIAIVAVPRWRARYGPLVVGAALLGTVGTFVAKESGEALADQVGMPADHAEWGDRLFIAAVVFAVIAVTWFVLDLRRRREVAAHDAHTASSYSRAEQPSIADPSAPSRLAGAAAVVLSVVVLGLTVVVGHSGATAVWGDTKLEAASSPVSSADGPTPGGVPSGAGTAPASPTAGSSKAPSSNPGATMPSTTRPSSNGPSSYALTQVKAHRSSSSCWAAIDGSVYDLTAWVGRHPGGSAAILGLCGTDASAAFHAQHGSQRRPARELAAFKIGRLS